MYQQNQNKGNLENSQKEFKRQQRKLNLPAFFPDATYAAIHSLPFDYVKDRLDGIVVTTLHMHLLSLEKEFESFGGYKQFAKLPEEKIILSDSGGFQVLSLISKHKLGKITDDGAIFTDEHGKKTVLTPEISQQIQKSINSDIRVVLDVPLMGDETADVVEDSLEKTTEWAKRAKKEFLKLESLTEQEFTDTTFTRNADKSISFERPLLTGVVQGGNSTEKRMESGKALSDIGFDVFGFGGWPVDSEGKLLTKVLEAFVASVPSSSLKYGMGVGMPDDIATCFKMGIELFDCVIPTRNARHGMLFVSKGNGEKYGETHDVIRIKSSKYQFEDSPIDPNCSCPVCKNYNRSYIRFLLKNKNPVGYTLASVHNVWWYLDYIEELN